MSVRRLAILSVHTSPLAQPGSGDGGGLNVYVRALASSLARAGVGRLTIVDRDYVEPSNLQRQWLFTESDAADALPKAAAAVHRLAEINQDVRAEAIVADLTSANIAAIAKMYGSRTRCAATSRYRA